MGLLEFRHIDRNQVVLAAVKEIGQSQRRFGLPYPARPHQHEDADWLVRVVETGAGSLNPLANHVQSVRLPNHAIPQHVLQ